MIDEPERDFATMNRKIEFRGREIKTGKYLYADVTILLMRDMRKIDIVDQLIAIDKNGRKVFERDKVRNFEGDRIWAASFNDFFGINNGFVILAEAANDD